jgi:hypothetical protein
VILTQRLILVVLATFVHDVNTRQLLLSLTLLVFLLSLAQLQPFADKIIYYIHFISSSILLVFAILNLPSATMLADSVSPSAALLSSFDVSNLVQAILLPIPFLAALIYFLMTSRRFRSRCCWCCGFGSSKPEVDDAFAPLHSETTDEILTPFRSLSAYELKKTRS